MAKKDFKSNPALQFFSAEEEQEAPAEETKQATPEKPRPSPPKPSTAKKKEPRELEQPTAIAAPPEGYKLNPLYVEVKSRRLQLVLQPSLYKKVKAAAKRQKVSVNEYCHQILEQATREE